MSPFEMPITYQGFHLAYAVRSGYGDMHTAPRCDVHKGGALHRDQRPRASEPGTCTLALPLAEW